MKFKHHFLVDHLGKNFVDNVIKSKIVNELMTTQKDQLKVIQPLVEWEKTVREQKKKTRFGIRMTTPPRPQISSISRIGTVFPCPIPNCRGFVEDGCCGLCEVSVCLRCREKMELNHVCKIENLQSIALLAHDSKPCPRCCASIHRTTGCDHMFCTNCRTHFDWNTGNILQISSNGHYLNLQHFSQNVPLRDSPIHPPEGSCITQEFSMYRDRIKRDLIEKQKIDPSLLQCLWDDSNAVRLVKRKKYNQSLIVTEVEEILQNLQIRYLMGEITETAWSRQVYHVSQGKVLSLLYADILNLYLATVDIYQQAVVNQPDQQDQLLPQYAQLIDLCNASFASVQEEYGGFLHHIRHPLEDRVAPPFI
jgi:hypothetical protein